MRRTNYLVIAALAVTVLMSASHIEGAGIGNEMFAKNGEELDVSKVYCAFDEALVAEENGIVTDTATGLQWVVGPDRDTTWDEAVTWVEHLSVDGGGWRMPKREELRTLYRKGDGERNMSSLLETTGGFVWTDEVVGSKYAWGFCYEIGDAFWPRHTFSNTARGFAVRVAR